LKSFIFIQEKYNLFKNKISDYCKNNVGEKVLFPLFVNLSPKLEMKITPKNLTILTSKIINELIQEKRLKEIPKKFENVYGMYKILH